LFTKRREGNEDEREGEGHGNDIIVKD